MSHLYETTDPRHARMFELLRQTGQAEQTYDRVCVKATKQLDDQVAETFKQNALQSLRFQG